MTKPFTFRSDPDSNPATTDSYAAVPVTTINENEFLDYFIATSSGPIALNWKNTGSNSIDVKILGGNESDLADADKAEVLAETAIAAGSSLAYSNAIIPIAYYQYYWFMHKATSGGSQGNTQLLGRHARV